MTPTGRARASLARAPAPERLVGFPAWHVHAGTLLHRVTARGRGPWWFGSDGGGRFDLDPPRGTCYLADDPLVALLESLGPLRFAGIDRADLEDRVLWTVALPEQCTAADTTARAARGHGVTAEVATVVPYELPRRWAAALAKAGFGGIRYRARHDPAGGRALALFGAAGERRRGRRGRSTPAGTLAERLAVECRVVVAPRPSLLDLVDVREDVEPGPDSRGGGSVT